MAGKKPKKSEEIIYAEEGLRVDIQWHIHARMKNLGIDECELAKRLGVKVRSVKRMFGSDMNMRLKTIARIYHALGDEVRFGSKGEAPWQSKKDKREARTAKKGRASR
jgi:hypothetical protein